MKVQIESFGNLPDGREVKKFILSNDNGMEVHIINYGAAVTSLIVPDKNHEPGDVVLGFNTLDEYLGDHPYFGVTAGRFCNRIGGAKFAIDDETFDLTANEGSNQLHGGNKGFDKVLWEAGTEKSDNEVSVNLTYLSPEGEEGYPGNLKAEVNYTLGIANELYISLKATTDRATHVNLTNHSYFNLNNCSGDIYDHLLMIRGEKYTVLDSESIPTGEIRNVDGTPYDFREPKPVGQELEQAGGYDLNFVLDKGTGEFDKAAVLYDPVSERKMEVWTTQPGIQLYSGNYLAGIPGKEGNVYYKHGGLCLETQHFPDSPNKPSFPNTVLYPGDKYEERILYRFTL